MDRRKFSREFKQEAVRLSYEKGGTQAGRELGINPNMLYRWRKELNEDKDEAFRGQGKMKAEQAEIARLKREMANLKEENEILKKAITIFSKPQ